MPQPTLTNEMKDQILLQICKTWRFFYIDFIKTQIQANLINGIQINMNILQEAISHAFVDIERMSQFHLPPADRRPDRHKWSGFMAKWIAKMRPIYCTIPGKAKHNEIIQTLNAHFATYIFRCFLYLKPNAYHDSLAKNLLYSFHYRDERGETLALIAYCYESMAT